VGAMTWKRWAIITAVAVILVTLGMFAAIGTFTGGGGKEVRHIAVGQRTIALSHYKEMTQELLSNGVKIVADGHEITATADSVTVDGKKLEIDPTQDVEIAIDEAGQVSANGVTPAAAPVEEGANGIAEDAPEPAQP
jgi:ABC-type Na+ efflux pump permease subunit